MPIFKKVLFILSFLLALKFIASIGAASNLKLESPLVYAINGNIGALSAFVFLIMIYWLLLPFSKKRKVSAEEKQLPVTEKVLPEKEGVREEPIGRYIFTAVGLATCAAGLGYSFSDLTLGMPDLQSQIIAWISGIATGVLSFTKRWQLF